jgi:hypothetical protein
MRLTETEGKGSMAVHPNDQAPTAVAGFGTRSDTCADRRLANLSTYEMARRYGAAAFDVLQFVCECGRPDCRLLVTRAVFEFDPDSPPGSLLAYH